MSEGIERIDPDIAVMFKGRRMNISLSEYETDEPYWCDCVIDDLREPGKKLLLFHTEEREDWPLVVYDEEGQRLSYQTMKCYDVTKGSYYVGDLIPLGDGLVYCGSYVIDVMKLIGLPNVGLAGLCGRKIAHEKDGARREWDYQSYRLSIPKGIVVTCRFPGDGTVVFDPYGVVYPIRRVLDCDPRALVRDAVWDATEKEAAASNKKEG